MTEALKIERSNPVDEMLSDEEVIEYFLDCCREDREGLTLARAMAFAVQSLGEARTAKLMIPTRLNNPRLKARGFLTRCRLS
uniref:hypothetical protein n=1 Tax=Duodenibacillus massiliensis TaxID=1852381 RepID=UPI00307C84A9